MTTERTREGLRRRVEEDRKAKEYADSVRTPESQREIAALRERMGL